MDAIKIAGFVLQLNATHWAIDDILTQVVKARMGRAQYQEAICQLEAVLFHLDRAAELLKHIGG